MLASFSFVLALIASASAAAITAREPVVLEKRRELTIVMCKDLNLQPGGTDGGNWNDQVTSAAILAETNDRPFTCTLFADLSCSGRSLQITSANFDLRQNGFDDTATSVLCQFS
ncbi:hypothetical protein HGRIS_006728 [Hohenbuehelia grisea]|uniref:Uncharacterized protein n=1 Tax=Hohenbuehelia grisea TaxID=104357 RepID=A0ABR3J9V0_9AGAR